MRESKRENTDGVVWRCSKRIGGRQHFKEISIRVNSLFSYSHLQIREAVLIIYEWTRKTPRNEVAFQLQIDEATVGDWYEKCREAAAWFICNRQSNRIGGLGSIIEIDECQIGRRKHHRGRVPREVWVFGAVERGSLQQRLFIEVVKKRDKETLTEIICN
jgi:hypothetical protein